MRITFIIADTYRTEVAMIHEGQQFPYRKRTVTLELTQDQEEEVSPLVVGKRKGEEVFEEILECFVENGKD